MMRQLPRVKRRSYDRDITALIGSLRTPGRVRSLRSVLQVSVEQARDSVRRRPANRNVTSRVATRSGRRVLLYCWKTCPDVVGEIKSHITAELPNGTQGRCPYCAMTTDVYTFDHFVEKSSVPELALFYRNLIPSCAACNTLRHTTFDSNGQQRVFHAYDDPIDTFPHVLFADLSEVDGAPAARFFVQSPVPFGGELYARHFKALKLGHRYSRWAASRIREILTMLRAPRYDTTRIDVLREYADLDQTEWGPNEPNVALMRAMALREDLLSKWISKWPYATI